MRHMLLRFLSITVLGCAISLNASAQDTGDYRSVSDGDWSAAMTWESFDGSNWTAAAAAPSGSESITIADDTVTVDIEVSITGHVAVDGTGVLDVGAGSLEFADGGTYEHARDAGDLPSATWAEGSTYLITGTVQDTPGNRNQNFYHITINTPDLGRNRDLSLDDVTISGNVHVISTGDVRWYLSSTSAADSASVTILGDVIVEDGQFAVQGTGNALTTFEVHHHGDINVTGGNFSIGRGSQGSGSGTTTWYLHDGDFLMSNAATQNSNPTPGNARFVFASNGTQQLSFENVNYAGGDINFEVSDSTTLAIGENFEVNGLLENRGEIDAMSGLTFTDGAVYAHARNGGTVPTATWGEGSTAVFAGITTNAPGDRGQDYNHLILDTPDLISNVDLGLDGHSVRGNLSVLNSGSARWRLVGGSSGTVSIWGDLIIRDAAFETQGTGSATDVTVHHHGNVDVRGGNFSVSRGSQGGGQGTTTWILHSGDFSMSDARTQNSNSTPGNAKFVFTKPGVQQLTLEGDNQIDNLSIEVQDGTSLDVGTSEIGGNGVFIVRDGAMLSTSHEEGVAGAVQTTGDVTFEGEAGFTFNGSTPQVTSTLMPTAVEDLVIDNEAGATLSQETTVNGTLRLIAGAFDNTIPLTLGPEAEIVTEGGSLTAPISTAPPPMAGDFRAAANGDWNSASTWETYDGSLWQAASAAPTGAETVFISRDTVVVNSAVTVSGYVYVSGTGLLDVDAGTLEFADGSTYEHARDEGEVPSAEWAEGSTFLLTGTVQDAPANRNQSYHHVTFNTPELGRNRDLGLNGVTIGGDVTVVSTGSNRWYLTSASAAESASLTILGDVLVEDGQFAVQGTGNALTEFEVHHHGDIVVTGGNFSIGRGSQGSGSGTTTWYLYDGDFTMSNAATQNSNPEPGNAKFVFAEGGTQQLSFENVDYAGGDIHFEVSDSTSLEITSDFEANGLFVNRGEVLPQGELVFIDGGIYEHARDAGDLPTATWEEGSTYLLTGTLQDAPGNRNQNFHHVTINTPDLGRNRDLGLNGVTIGGDVHVISTGSVRWYLSSASATDSAGVTILGDVIVDDGQFAVQGTGNALTTFEVHHYGNIDVTGGNFSVSRGSQGDGSGTTTWYLYDGDFSLSNATTQNSNPTPGNAKFVFTKDGVQQLTLGEGSDVSNLSIAVADSATLDVGTSEIGGSGIFQLDAGATLATAHEDGVAGSIQTSGFVSFDHEAGFAFNGSTPQVTSALMPTVVQNLTIDNEEGVTLSQETTINGVLRLLAGQFDNTIPFEMGPDGEILREGGSILITTSTEAPTELPTEFALHQNYPNPFNPSTVIRYDIRERSDVSVTIYDVGGREIMELVHGDHAPGTYQVEWNAAGLSSGVYYYQIRAGEFSATRSLLLVK